MFCPFDKCGLDERVENEETAHRKIALRTQNAVGEAATESSSPRQHQTLL